jgi:transcriptional regulator with XRE-family HTH domain
LISFDILSSVLLSYEIQYERKQNTKLNIKQNIKHKSKECQVSHLPVDTKRWLIRILIELTGKTASSIASLIGIHRSGLTEWLKGRTTLGSESQDKVLQVLGIVEGSLDLGRVHIWKIFEDLTSFREILFWNHLAQVERKTTIPEIVRLGPKYLGPQYLFNFPVSESLYAISGTFRAVIRRSIPPAAPVGAVRNIEATFYENVIIPILEWRHGIEKDPEFGNEPTLKIDNPVFDKWWVLDNENVSLEEFDTIVHGNGKVAEEKKGWRPKSQPMTKVELMKEPLFSLKLQDEPDWALVERITGKKCPETVSLRNLSRMTQTELRETLGLTDVQGKKLGAALVLGERLANEAIERINQRLEKEKQDHSKDPGPDSSL